MSDEDGRVVYIVDSEPIRFSWRKLWSFLGPGLLMSIAYVDPGNLESDLQMGAATGYVLLWLVLWSTIMGYIIQMQAAKLGVVTGKHLAEHCREQYPSIPNKLLWIMVEVAIVGSDIQEVIGSAIAIAVLTRGAVPLWVGVLLSATSAFMLLLVERFGTRLLEAVFGVMIAVMIATFGLMYVDADVPVVEVAKGFLVPYMPKDAISVGVAMVGSLIMPHNIYLHSALVQTRRLSAPTPRQKREAMLYFSIESGLSLLGAIFINTFVVAVFARAFYGQAPQDIGLENAGNYLGASYGPAVVAIWGLGLLAAGQSSTMTGTYTGQFVMSGFLDLKVSPLLRVTITRLFAIGPTLAVAFIYSDSTKLDALNQWLNVLQSIQLPFALIPVLTLTSDKTIMGSFVTKSWELAVCWLIAVTVVAINITAAVTLIGQVLYSSTPLGLVAIVTCALLYCIFVGYLLIGPKRSSSMLSGCVALATKQHRWHRLQHSDVAVSDTEQPLLAATSMEGGSLAQPPLAGS